MIVGNVEVVIAAVSPDFVCMHSITKIFSVFDRCLYEAADYVIFYFSLALPVSSPQRGGRGRKKVDVRLFFFLSFFFLNCESELSGPELNRDVQRG